MPRLQQNKFLNFSITNRQEIKEKFVYYAMCGSELFLCASWFCTLANLR